MYILEIFFKTHNIVYVISTFDFVVVGLHALSYAVIKGLTEIVETLLQVARNRDNYIKTCAFTQFMF